MDERSRRRPLAALASLGAVAATTLTAVTGTGAIALAGTVTPAIGATPHYRLAGHVGSDPSATTFSCQTPTAPIHCYGPDQIRTAYGVDKLGAHGLDGRGRTIVIVDAFQSPSITSDLATFNAVFGLPSAPLRIIAPDGLTPFDPNDPNETGWAGEITLDVEYAHAIAPAATVDLVLAKSNQDADILSATKYAVQHNLGDVISQSFGEDERCVDPTLLKAQTRLFQQATNKGITLLASSGDQGAAQPTCDGTSFSKAVSSPAVDPNVTAVGGTILDADLTTGAYHSETTWNEPAFAVAGGGGFSTLVKTPAYQRSLRLPSRGVPDVSYNAAIDGGVLAVYSPTGDPASQAVYIFGGTSAGSPQWAGLVALTTQLAHHRQGLLNPRLYAFAHPPLYNALFHDITTGDNTYHGDVTVQGYPAAKGWDPATGIGTPRADRLVPLLAVTRH